MAEVGFPGQHMTTTTVTSSTAVQTNIRFDPSYLRTVPGILKIIQIACSLLGFICIQWTVLRYLDRGSYFSTIAMIAFWFSGILLGFYLFHILEKFYKIPWLKVEFVFCALWTLLYLIASSLAVAIYNDSFKAAGVFGFMATAAYAIDAVMKWFLVRAGGLAQGSRVVSVSKQTAATVEAPPPPRQGY